MGISTTPSAIAKLVQTTYDHFLAARAALKISDRSAYEREMGAVQLGLEELMKVVKELPEQFNVPRISLK